MGVTCLKKFLFVSTENKIVIVSFVNKVLLNDFGTSEDEFEKIIAAVESKSSFQHTRTNGRRDYVYEPWMVNAFKLFLFIGGRREEVLSLK